ncbi:MAG TPA: CpaF family protein [Blastocatellia bacterium]|nr:CpaF family protein [Blastocatellia bacterium]
MSALKNRIIGVVPEKGGEVKSGNGADSPGGNGKSGAAFADAGESALPVAQPVIREVIALPRPPVARRDVYQELKTQIHQDLIRRLDLTKLDTIEPAVLQAEISRIVQEMLEARSVPLSMAERERIVVEVRDELFGLGPLEPLLNDPTISDILVNTYKQVYVERFGKLQLTDVMFKDDEHLMQIIDRIVSRVGRRIDESSPMVDARLPDGSRVNAIIPPLAIDGPILSIRRFGTVKPSIEELIKKGTLTPAIARLLEGCVKCRLNIIISGGTGAGKTTLLNALSSFIPSDERIITIEDSAELQLQQEHVVRLETRPPNIEGKGEVTQRDLVRNSLRMRPDRIILGEVRGAEAIDMLQAMNTGHDGSLATIHANSPRDALARLETMCMMAGLKLSEKAIRQQIASAINLIIQVARLSDGTRKVISISEITGMEGDIISMQDIFVFERLGIQDGRVIGEFRATGIRPRFAEKLQRAGFTLPSTIFAPAAMDDQ